MRALIGLFLLLGVALGVDRFSGQSQASQSQASKSPDAAMSLAGMVPGTPAARGPMIKTVAATDPNLPQVEAAPGAPHAAPIDPIVAPLTKLAPKSQGVPAAAAPAGKAKGKSAKSKSDGAATRPGFKLTCTSNQKLDTARQKCVPLKGTTVAGASKKA